MSTKPKEAITSGTQKVLEAKWGKTLIAAGFTALPDVIFQYQKALKLKPLDILIGEVTENGNNRTLARCHSAQRIFSLQVGC